MFLYQVLEQQIREQIESGQLAFGSRLPSVRALCQEQDLSKATVLNAYARLEAAGLIEARPKSGYFRQLYHSAGWSCLRKVNRIWPRLSLAWIRFYWILWSRARHLISVRTVSGMNITNLYAVAWPGRPARKKRQEQQYYDEPAGLSGLRQQLVRRCADAGSMVQAG